MQQWSFRVMNVIKCLMVLFLVGVGAIGESTMPDKQQSWYFRVFLDDKPIGYHEYRMTGDDDQYIMSIKAEFDVQFLFLSVYSYAHNNSETWQNQCLTQLSSTTDDNGEDLFVRFRAVSDGFRIDTPEETQKVNGCVRSFAYWNLDLLKSDRLLNAQTGELVDIELKSMGAESITLGDWPVEAERYQIKGKDLEIDLWYSSSKEWLALRSITKDGYTLQYEREFMAQ